MPAVGCASLDQELEQEACFDSESEPYVDADVASLPSAMLDLCTVHSPRELDDASWAAERSGKAAEGAGWEQLRCNLHLLPRKRVSRKSCNAGCGTPKRRSLMDIIDEDHPKSRSSVAEARRSTAAARTTFGDIDSDATDETVSSDTVELGETSSSSDPTSPRDMAPGPSTMSIAQVNMLRVQKQAEAGPRRGPSCVWTQPLLVPPEGVGSPTAERHRRHRVRKPRSTKHTPSIAVDASLNNEAPVCYSDPEEQAAHMAQTEVWQALAQPGLLPSFSTISLDAYAASPPSTPDGSNTPPPTAPVMAPAPVYPPQIAQQHALAMQQMMMQHQMFIMQQQLQQTHYAYGLPHLAPQLMPYPMLPLQQHAYGMAGVRGVPCSAATPAMASSPGSTPAVPSINVINLATAAASLSANHVPWGQLLDLATDAKGSRVLQDAVLRLCNPKLVGVRDELAPHLLMLAQHPFGNYVVGTLASVDLMHARMVGAFRGSLVRLLCHAQSSRVVQALLSALPAADADGLIGELDGHVLEVALDTHGSWGVSAAFERTRAPFILTQISCHVVALATQQNGCRVVQAVLKSAGNAGMDLAPAVARIIDGGLDRLAAHCFGNYVVQVLLRQSASPQRDLMVKQLLPQVLSLSTSKHGSNVAESVLSLTPQRMLESVCDEVFGAVSTPGHPSEPVGDALRSLIEHPFGNYVLQTLVRRLVNPSRRSYAIDKIRAASSPANFGRSILARLGSE